MHGLLEAAASSPMRKSPTDGVKAHQSGLFPSTLGKQQLCSLGAASLPGSQAGSEALALWHLPQAVCHLQPSSHTSSTPLLSSPEKQGVCIAAVTGALPLLEAVGVLSLGKHFSSPRLWHGWSQHSPPGFPVMWDSPAAVQKNSPLQIYDGDLKFCLQGPEGVEPGESCGVLRRGQPLRARRGSGVGFPES